MKNKLKTLISAGVVAGQVLSGGVAMAAGGINAVPVPVGEQGPELYLEWIDVDAEKVSLIYYDRGAREGRGFHNVNIVAPKTEEELRAQNPTLAGDGEIDFGALAAELTDSDAWWGRTFYNGNDANYLPSSGWGLEIPAAQPDTYKLKDNEQNILYYSVKLVRGLDEDVVFWTGKADYNDCMRYYQPGVVCKAQIQEDLSIKYRPFLNGEEMEMTESGGAENDDSGSGNLEGGDSEGSIEESSAPASPINKPVASVADLTTTTQPVLLAGVGSAVIDSGSGAEYDETDEADVADAENTENADESATELVLATDETEVPELGGSKQDNYWLLVLGALAVAAGALMLWWWVILPLLKRKKEEEDAQE